MSARALLLVAHGSRRAQANEEIAQLAARLRGQARDWDIVRHAFLEMAEPSVAQGVAQCVADGALLIVLVPYFLAAGRHVQEDLPALAKEAREAHPLVRIESRTHTGASPQLPELLLHQAAGAPV